ncbi:MAG: hypothetical protein IJ723_08155 [Ruminococcus sp.]|nr:hypothetical protein [Ruminococcus sp.]
MESYWGFKCKQDAKRMIIALVVFVLLILLGVKTLSGDLGGSEDKANIAVDIIFILLCLCGAAIAVLRIVLRSLAFKVAKYFYSYPQIEIDAGLVGAELKIKSPVKTLMWLQRRGYLSNIKLDRKTNNFLAYIKEPQQGQPEGHPVKCPSCGANCRVYPDRMNVCPVCETKLIIGENVDLL